MKLFKRDKHNDVLYLIPVQYDTEKLQQDKVRMTLPHN